MRLIHALGGIRTTVVAVVLATAAALLPAAPVSAQPTSFTFSAAGDHGANSDTTASLDSLAVSGSEYYLALGDLSYDQMTPESAWCTYVKSHLPANYPFELVSGNHEDDGPNGLISNFRQCLPNQLGGAIGDYAKEYYFDYPTTAPLARTIMISPALTFPGESTYSYGAGTSHRTWLANAIDGARASGILWVIVGMHKNCISAGAKSCEIGADLFNFLVQKKVDLILQGHDHNYQRSKQLALGTSCTAIATNSFNPGCVADDGADGQYTKGAGPILMIVGTFGRGLYNVSSGDSEGAYFAKLMGSNLTAAHGFMKYTVTTTSLSAQFVRSSGAAFTDSFTISGTGGGGGGGGGGNTAPTASAASASTVAGTPVTATMRGTDAETCDLGFMIDTQPAHGTLSPVADNPCTTGTPNTDTALVTYTPAAGFTGTDSFQYQVSDGVVPSNLATVTITVSASGGGGGTLTQPFPASADASIYGDSASNRAANFGTAQTLEADTSPLQRFLIKFDVTGVTGRTVTGIKLHLSCANSSNKGGDFRPTATNTWIESGTGGVTWNNQPSFNASVAPLASLGAVSSGSAYDVVLPTSFITGDGTYSLVVTSTSSDGVDFWSREKGGTLAPQLRVTTTDGGPPPLSSLSINDTSVTEGNTGSVNATFTVTLSPAASQTATVIFGTMANTATEDVDFMMTDGTLSFAPGETTKTLSVPVTGDTTTEANETFFVNLSSPVNATIADGQGLGTIIDNDGVTPPPPSVLPFPASADASIYGDTTANKAANFGTAQTVEVDNSPIKRFLIKFDVTGVTGRTVTGIKLHLSCTNSSSKGGDFRPTATNTWTDSGTGGVTWNTQPAFNAGAAPLASLGSVSSGSAYDVVLPASFITGDGTYSLVVTSTSSDGADYWSREKGGTLAPQLRVTVS